MAKTPKKSGTKKPPKVPTAPRVPQAIARGYPSDPAAYTSLGSKHGRYYRINATGEEVTRRDFLTATRGVSNEEYVKKPVVEKKRLGRGGRGAPSKRSKVSVDGHLLLVNYKWVIKYEEDQWARFETQVLKILGDLPERRICQFKFQIKGNGEIALSGVVRKQGRLFWLIGDNFAAKLMLQVTAEVGFTNALQEMANITAGYIDYPIVKSVLLQYKEPISEARK